MKLVTGGGGFLGSHLVRALLARGDRVRILARGRYPGLEALGAEAVEGDVSNPPDVARAVAGAGTVFHVAGKPGIAGPHSEYVRINVDGTRQVIEACRKSGVPRLVFTSSPSAVFGEGSLEGVDEDTPYPARYLASYPETKAAAERLVLAAHEPGRLHTVGLRPHLIFGPGDNHLIPRIVDRASKGRLLRVGDGTNRISVTYVANAVEAHLAAERAIEVKESPAGGKTYFINEPEPVVLWDFVYRILDGLGVPRPPRSISYRSAYRLGAVLETAWRVLGLAGEPRMTRFLAGQLALSHWFKIDRAVRDLAYRPVVTLEEGLRRTLDAARSAPGAERLDPRGDRVEDRAMKL